MRNTCEAFGFDASLQAELEGSVLVLRWARGGKTAELRADLSDYSYTVRAQMADGELVLGQR